MIGVVSRKTNNLQIQIKSTIVKSTIVGQAR